MSDQMAAPDFPAAWRPDKDDPNTIKGTVASVAMGPDFGFGSYPIVTLNTDEGERTVHAMHSILRQELARRRPKPGDEIAITYLGKRSPKSGTGNPFHVYKVSGGQEPEFNWDAELPEEERRQQISGIPIPQAPAPSQSPPAPSGQQFGDDAPF